MTLILILAIFFTIALGVEAFSNDAVANRIAKIVKFGVGLAFVISLLT